MAHQLQIMRANPIFSYFFYSRTITPKETKKKKQDSTSEGKNNNNKANFYYFVVIVIRFGLAWAKKELPDQHEILPSTISLLDFPNVTVQNE